MYQYPCVCGESTMSFKFDIGGPFTGECCAIAKAVAKTKESLSQDFYSSQPMEEVVEAKKEDKKSKKGRK